MNKHITASFVILLLFFIVRISHAETKDSSKEAGMTLERAIDIVLTNNLTLQSAKFDLVMSDTEYQYFNKKFSPVLSIEGAYSRQKLPQSGDTAFTGDKSYRWDTAAMLSKIFSTGTTVSGGIRNSYYDSNDPEIRISGDTLKPKDPPYYNPALFVSIQQELLKNAFGYTDRLQARILNNSSEIRRRIILDQLTELVMSTLIDYWRLTVQRSAVENARLELESNREVREIIARNTRYGVMDQYGLYQFNALVAASESKLEVLTQNYRESYRRFLRILNMPPDITIKEVTELTDALPAMEAEDSLRTAYAKRADYRNALLEMENVRMDLRRQENDTLPSVTLEMSATSQGLNRNGSQAMAEASGSEYPGYQVGLKAAYPLDDTGQKADFRNAHIRLKQARIKLDNLNREISDDVISRLERVKSQHAVLAKSRTSRAESGLYYKRVLFRFGQGKVSSLDMKMALDAMVQFRQQELESLVQFNIAILQLDMARNMIFERFHVNVDKYLKSNKGLSQ